MYVHCAYPAKSPKQVPNCLKIADTSVVIIIFNGVLWSLRLYCYSFLLSRYKNQVSEKNIIRSM